MTRGEMEDGMTDEDAVAALGPMDEIVDEIKKSLPLFTVVRTRVDDARERSRVRGGSSVARVAILLLTSPFGIALIAVVLSLAAGAAAVLFSLVLAFTAAAVSLIASGLVIAVMAFVLPGGDLTGMEIETGLVIIGLGGIFDTA